MAQEILYTLISVIIVSLVSFVGILPLLWKRKSLDELLLFLVSLSAGTLFGGALLHLLPEAVEKNGFGIQVSLLVLAGVLVFFILERIIHWQHCHLPSEAAHLGHKHHLGILNLVGDGLHNLMDGLVIAGSYLVSIPAGIATTIAVVVHEVPQEIADFGVLLYAGYSKTRALLFNFISAAVAIVGAVIGLVLGARSEMFIPIILPFAAGGFLYIAGSNLIPELHKECDLRDSVLHFLAMLLGIGMMAALRFLG